jgi:hypothetical protein
MDFKFSIHIFNDSLSRWSFESMPLRSGKEFNPHATKRVFNWLTRQADPVSTSVKVEPLIQAAVALEDDHFEQSLSDSEGLGVSLRPLSPLTEYETDTEPEVSDHPSSSRNPGPGNPGPLSIDKKRRNAARGKRRARKRAKTAASGHQPHTYAANPSTVQHHVKESDVLHVCADAGGFSASGSGSWVGKRKEGAKKEPWTVPELLNEGFKVIEWDGR